MAVRPGQIRYLTKGKLLGAKSHAGFVDTFNWMLSWIYNFRTGPGLSLVGERGGHPRLSLTLLNEDGAPIDDGGDDTPYEITGSGGIGGSCSGFKYAGGSIGVGSVNIRRQSYKANEEGFAVSVAEGDQTVHHYRLKMTIPESSDEEPEFAVEEGDGFEAPSDGVVYFPLYDIQAGEVVADYRGTPVVTSDDDEGGGGDDEGGGGSGGGGSGGEGGGYDPWNPGGSGGGGGGGDDGSGSVNRMGNCNQWSDDVPGNEDDSSTFNWADDCTDVNGW